MQRLAPDLEVVAVGFDPAPVLAGVAADLGWHGAFLTDPGRALYRRLGLRRAPWWRVWSPRTLLFYARAERGEPDRAPSTASPIPASSAIVPTDVRQMGGDAVVVAGEAVACWRPRTPVGRVDPVLLVATARRLLG